MLFYLNREYKKYLLRKEYFYKIDLLRQGKYD